MDDRTRVTLDCDLGQLRAMIESGHGDVATLGRRFYEVLLCGEGALASIALALYGVRFVPSEPSDADGSDGPDAAAR